MYGVVCIMWYVRCSMCYVYCGIYGVVCTMCYAQCTECSILRLCRYIVVSCTVACDGINIFDESF